MISYDARMRTAATATGCSVAVPSREITSGAVRVLSAPAFGRDVARVDAYRDAMAVVDRVERARGSFERRLWASAFAELAAEDLERLAIAAYMVGRDDACEEAWIAAHREWTRRGDAERAAGCAFRQALGLFFHGDLAPAMGWVARGRRLLEESRCDCVEQAWLRMLSALPELFEGVADAGARFVEAGEIAERFADPEASMFARLGHGYSLILEGQVAAAYAAIGDRPGAVVVVSDEVGSGIVPMHPNARTYRDLVGIAHQRLAAMADEAYLFVAGLPVTLKGPR